MFGVDIGTIIAFLILPGIGFFFGFILGVITGESMKNQEEQEEKNDQV